MADLSLESIKSFIYDQKLLAADKDGNGKLDAREKALFTYNAKYEDALVTLGNALSEGKSGFAEYSAYADLINDTEKLEQDKANALMMFELDKDHDGTVTKNEAKAIKDSNQNARNIFSMMGESEAVFDLAHMERYALLADADGDNQVSNEEAKAFGTMVADHSTDDEFMSVLKKYMNGTDLSTKENKIIETIKDGSYKSSIEQAQKESLDAIKALLKGAELTDVEYNEEGSVTSFKKGSIKYTVKMTAETIELSYKATVDTYRRSNNKLAEKAVQLQKEPNEIKDVKTYATDGKTVETRTIQIKDGHDITVDKDAKITVSDTEITVTEGSVTTKYDLMGYQKFDDNRSDVAALLGVAGQDLEDVVIEGDNIKSFKKDGVQYSVSYEGDNVKLSYTEDGKDTVDTYNSDKKLAQKETQLLKSADYDIKDVKVYDADGETVKARNIQFADGKKVDVKTDAKVRIDGEIVEIKEGATVTSFRLDGTDPGQPQIDAKAKTVKFLNGKVVNIPEGFEAKVNENGSVTFTRVTGDTTIEQNYSASGAKVSIVTTDRNTSDFTGLAKITTVPITDGAAEEAQITYSFKGVTYAEEDVKVGADTVVIVTTKNADKTIETSYDKMGDMTKTRSITTDKSFANGVVKNIITTVYDKAELPVGSPVKTILVGNDEYSASAKIEVKGTNIVVKNGDTTVVYNAAGEKIRTAETTENYGGVSGLSRVVTTEVKDGKEEVTYNFNDETLPAGRVEVDTVNNKVTITSVDGNTVKVYDKDGNMETETLTAVTKDFDGNKGLTRIEITVNGEVTKVQYKIGDDFLDGEYANDEKAGFTITSPDGNTVTTYNNKSQKQTEVVTTADLDDNAGLKRVVTNSFNLTTGNLVSTNTKYMIGDEEVAGTYANVEGAGFTMTHGDTVTTYDNSSKKTQKVVTTENVDGNAGLTRVVTTPFDASGAEGSASTQYKIGEEVLIGKYANVAGAGFTITDGNKVATYNAKAQKVDEVETNYGSVSGLTQTKTYKVGTSEVVKTEYTFNGQKITVPAGATFSKDGNNLVVTLAKAGTTENVYYNAGGYKIKDVVVTETAGNTVTATRNYPGVAANNTAYSTILSVKIGDTNYKLTDGELANLDINKIASVEIFNNKIVLKTTNNNIYETTAIDTKNNGDGSEEQPIVVAGGTYTVVSGSDESYRTKIENELKNLINVVGINPNASYFTTGFWASGDGHINDDNNDLTLDAFKDAENNIWTISYNADGTIKELTSIDGSKKWTTTTKDGSIVQIENTNGNVKTIYDINPLTQLSTKKTVITSGALDVAKLVETTVTDLTKFPNTETKTYKLNGIDVPVPEGATIVKFGDGVKVTFNNADDNAKIDNIAGVSLFAETKTYDADGKMTQIVTRPYTYTNPSWTYYPVQIPQITINNPSEVSGVSIASGSPYYYSTALTVNGVSYYAGNYTTTNYLSEAMVIDGAGTKTSVSFAKDITLHPTAGGTITVPAGAKVTSESNALGGQICVTETRGNAETKTYYTTASAWRGSVTTITNGDKTLTITDNANGYPSYENGRIWWSATYSIPVPAEGTVTINSASDVQVVSGNKVENYTSNAALKNSLTDNRSDKSEYPKLEGTNLYLASGLYLRDVNASDKVTINEDGSVSVADDAGINTHIGTSYSALVPAGAKVSSEDGKIVVTETKGNVETKSYYNATGQISKVVTTVKNGDKTLTINDSSFANIYTNGYPKYENGKIWWSASSSISVPEEGTVTINSASDVKVVSGNKVENYTSNAALKNSLTDNRIDKSAEYPKLDGTNLYLASGLYLRDVNASDKVTINEDGSVSVADDAGINTHIGTSYSALVPAGAKVSSEDGKIVVTETKGNVETKSYYTATGQISKVVTTVKNGDKTLTITDNSLSTYTNNYPKYENGKIYWSSNGNFVDLPEEGTITINSAADVQVVSGNKISNYTSNAALKNSITDNREEQTEYPRINGTTLYFSAGKQISLTAGDKVTVNADGTVKIMHSGDNGYFDTYNEAGFQLECKNQYGQFVDNTENKTTQYPSLTGNLFYFSASSYLYLSSYGYKSVTVNADGTVTFIKADGTEVNYNQYGTKIS